MAVVTEAVLIFEISLPANIGGIDPLKANRPLLDRQADYPTTASTGRAARRINLLLAIDVSACISGVVKDA
jgi:hypothetical protein